MKIYKSLDKNMAREAYRNTSFVPDERAERIIQNYNNNCDHNYHKLKTEGLCTEINKEIIKTAFDKYHSLYTSWLQKKSRCFSAMITGPSGFNNQRHHKSNNAEHVARDKLLLYDVYKQVNKLIKKRDKNLEYNVLLNRGFETVILFDIGWVKAVNNKSLERVQLIFNDKPSEEIRTKLKAEAFRWSPTNNAWQRKNTANGIYSIKRLEKFLKEGNHE